MTWLQALVLGVVEGITEFLPVSSTGHLILAERALGIEATDATEAYAVVIQAGAILAVAGLYRGRILQVLRGLVGKDAEGLQLGLSLVAAFAPAAVFGLAFSHTIKEHLFGLWPVAAAWVVGGIAILALRDKMTLGTRNLSTLTLKTSVLIGLAQCLALWPGTSRSLATIVGGVLCGLTLPAAVEFSFLLGLITLLAATAHDAHKYGDVMLHDLGAAPIVVGSLAAAVSGALAVKWLVGWLQSHGMEVFAVWRIGLGVIVVALILTGILPAM